LKIFYISNHRTAVEVDS